MLLLLDAAAELLRQARARERPSLRRLVAEVARQDEIGERDRAGMTLDHGDLVTGADDPLASHARVAADPAAAEEGARELRDREARLELPARLARDGQLDHCAADAQHVAHV